MNKEIIWFFHGRKGWDQAKILIEDLNIKIGCFLFLKRKTWFVKVGWTFYDIRSSSFGLIVTKPFIKKSKFEHTTLIMIPWKFW